MDRRPLTRRGLGWSLQPSTTLGAYALLLLLPAVSLAAEAVSHAGAILLLWLGACVVWGIACGAVCAVSWSRGVIRTHLTGHLLLWSWRRDEWADLGPGIGVLLVGFMLLTSVADALLPDSAQHAAIISYTAGFFAPSFAVLVTWVRSLPAE